MSSKFESNKPQVILCLILLSGYLFVLNFRRTSARLIIIIILLIIIICLLLTTCHADDDDGGGDNGDSLFLIQV